MRELQGRPRAGAGGPKTLDDPTSHHFLSFFSEPILSNMHDELLNYILHTHLYDPSCKLNLIHIAYIRHLRILRGILLV